MKKITLLIPVYNEADNLQALREALLPLIDNALTPKRYSWEVLMVNDGSHDDSENIMRRMCIDDARFVDLNLSRNFGKEAAMLAGLDYATGDAVVIMDADLQHPVKTIPEMIYWWEEGWNDVYGRRSNRHGESLLKRAFTRVYYSLLKRSTRFDVLPDVGDFRLLDRRCVESLRSLRETGRYTKGLYCWIGYKKKEVEFEVNDRLAGKSTFSFFRLFNLAIDGITGFTTAPLRAASVMGFIAAFGALAYMIYILIKTLLYGDPVGGFPTLICTILFLGGCQLISIGIIGEYIGRIFRETKNRPVYIADTFRGNPVDNHHTGNESKSRSED